MAARACQWLQVVTITASKESARGDKGVLEPDPSAPAGPGRVRVFAGQPDPKDPSAFEIASEVNGIRRAFRFVLNDKGGDAELRLEEQSAGGGGKEPL